MQPSSLNSTMFGGNSGYSPNNRWPVIGNYSATQSAWTREEDKVFERAILDFGEERPDRWHRIADRIPGKSPEEVRAHYGALVHDVFSIDSGRVEPPSYSDDSLSESSEIRVRSWSAKKKKGNPWTQKEHRLFLRGLQTFGKGDWRSISRNMVRTRTPTQVASHAQKYYLRHSALSKEKKRPSIHDTTTVDTCPIPPPAQFPYQGCSMGHQDFNHSM